MGKKRLLLSEGAARAQLRGSFILERGERRLSFQTQAGVFSQDGPDEGSLLLLESVLPEVKPHQTVLDLGCGVGLLGLTLAGQLSRGEVWLADSDLRAVRLTQANIDENRIDNAHAVLSDITLDLPRLRVDMVVTNPPTHSGKEVLFSFVEESFNILRPGGWLYLVVNRLLSVRDMMTATFGNVDLVQRRHGFLIYRSQKVRRGNQHPAGAFPDADELDRPR